MTQTNIAEFKTHISKYSERIRKGETIILCERNKPFAEIRPLKTEGKRPVGVLKGWVDFDDDDFFASDEDIETSFLQNEKAFE